MLQHLKKFWSILTPGEKGNFYFLTLLMVFGAWMELLGLGMVIPLVAVLTDPEILEKNRYLAWLYNFLSPGGRKEFLLYLCSFTILLFLLKNIYLFFLTYLQVYFISGKVSRMNEELFHNYIYAPLSYHTARGSSSILANFSSLQHLSVWKSYSKSAFFQKFFLNVSSFEFCKSGFRIAVYKIT